MINISLNGSAIQFEFEDSSRYLYGSGVIQTPINSLSLVVDESDLLTLVKSASNDPFISFLVSESNFESKEAFISWFKSNAVSSGGGGSVSGDVYTKSETDEKIAEAVSGKADTSAVTADIAAAVSGLAPYSAVTEDIDEALEDYYDKDEIDAAFSSVTESEQVTATALNDLNDRADTIEQVTAIALNDLNDNKADIDNVYAKVSGLTIELDGEAPRIFLEKESDGTHYEAIMNDVGFDSYLETEDGSTYDTNFAFGSIGQEAHDHPESGISSDRMFNISTDGFIQETSENDDESGYTRYSSYNEFNYETGLQLSQTWSEPDPDNEGEYIETTSRIELINNKEGETYIELINNKEGETYIQIEDGTNAVCIDAEGFDSAAVGERILWQDIATKGDVEGAVSGKADTSAVTSSITAAVSGKQDTLVSGTNIKTINNESLLGSGNITISGGSGGSNIVEVTQAQYEELVSGGTVDPDALYIITDASEINISDYAQSSAVTAEIAAAVSGKADTSAVTTVNNALTAHTANTNVHVTSSEKTTWSGKQDALVSGTNIKTINNESILGSGNITIQGGGGVSSGEVQTMINAAVSGKADTSAVTENEYVVSQAINALNTGKVDTSAITTAVTSASTDSQIPSAKAVYDAIPTGGTSVTVDQSLDTGSTNPVTNAAIATALNGKGDRLEWDRTGSVLKSVRLRLKRGSTVLSYSDLNLGDNLVYTSGGLSTSGLAQTSAVTAEIAAAVSGKADTSAVTENEYVVSQAINALNTGKVDTSAITTAVTSASTDSQIPSAKAVYDAIPTGGTSVTVDQSLDTGSTNAISNAAVTNGFNNYTCRRNSLNGEVRYFYFPSPSQPYGGGGQMFYNFSINGRCPLTQSNGTNENIDKFNLVETSAVTTSMTSGSTDSQVPSAKCVYDTLDGLKLKKVTQAQYDSMVSGGTLDNSTIYFITGSNS